MDQTGSDCPFCRRMSTSQTQRGQSVCFLPRRPLVWTDRADIWNLISQPFPDFEYGLEDIQLFPIPSEGQDERGAVSRDGPVGPPTKGSRVSTQHLLPMAVGQEHKQGHGQCSVPRLQGPCETLRTMLPCAWPSSALHVN